MNVFKIDTIELEERFAVITSVGYTDVSNAIESFVSKKRIDGESYTQDDIVAELRKEFKGYKLTVIPIDNIFNILA